MAVCHADAADDRTHDSDETLVRSAQENIGQMRGPIQLFVGRTINGTVVVPSEAADGFWREDVGIDHA